MIRQLAAVLALPPQPIVEEKDYTRVKPNYSGQTALHVAAIKGDHNRVKKLIMEGVNVNAPDYADWTPLHEACSYGWYRVVELLLMGGANVNIQGKDNQTPLHDATLTGNLNLVKLLMNHGANMFAKNLQGKRPKDLASGEIKEFYKSLKGSRKRSSDRILKSHGDKKVCFSNRSSVVNREHSDRDVSKSAFGSNNNTVREILQPSSVVASITNHDTVAGTNAQEVKTIIDNYRKKKNKNKKTSKKDQDPSYEPPSSYNDRHTQFVTSSEECGNTSKTCEISRGKNGGSDECKAESIEAWQIEAHKSHKKRSCSKKKRSKSSKKETSPRGSTDKSKSHSGSDKKTRKKVEQLVAETPERKVPPLRIVIPRGYFELDKKGRLKKSGKTDLLPYVVQSPIVAQAEMSSAPTPGTSNTPTPGTSGGGPTTSSAKGQTPNISMSTYKVPEVGKRVQRRHTARKRTKNSEPLHSGSGGYQSSKRSSKSVSSRYKPAAATTSTAQPDAAVTMHPKKRMLHCFMENESAQAIPVANVSFSKTIASNNPYKMHLAIKKQIEERNRNLKPICVTPPQNFNNYCMNRRTYTLQGNAENAENALTRRDVPDSVPAQMVDSFVEQEEERVRMQIQHTVEKAKLVLSVEQEMLRLHGMANLTAAEQANSYSVCTVLRNECVYGLKPPEKQKPKPSRSSGCSISQLNVSLGEIYKKSKEGKTRVLARQKIEAVSLQAVQSLSWHHSLRNLGLLEINRAQLLAPMPTVSVDPLHVPFVDVPDFEPLA